MEINLVNKRIAEQLVYRICPKTTANMGCTRVVLNFNS